MQLVGGEGTPLPAPEEEEGLLGESWCPLLVVEAVVVAVGGWLVCGAEDRNVRLFVGKLVLLRLRLWLLLLLPLLVFGCLNADGLCAVVGAVGLDSLAEDIGWTFDLLFCSASALLLKKLGLGLELLRVDGDGDREEEEPGMKKEAVDGRRGDEDDEKAE